MDAPTLFNLSPAARVMGMGVLVALLPLLWVWLKSRHAAPGHRLRMLTAITLFLTFDLVLFGAFTRLTDSGLGCPDWPGCYGHVSPLGASAHISDAQLAMPTGPVTWGKAWVEMIHRYLATGVGVLILSMTLVSWRMRDQLRVSPWWPTLTLLWVSLQGAFGAFTVTMKLFPAIVTMHLLGGLVLLMLLRMQALRYQHGTAWGRIQHGGWRFEGRNRALWLGVFALVWLQIALGGWVSTNYAVLACSEFPMCQGQWWPDMDFQHGFSLWRDLGQTHLGEALPFSALTAIHMVHRVGAGVALAGLGLLAWSLHRDPATRGTARWLMLLMLWQLASGLSNVVLDWPLLAAVSHTGGAAALIVVLTGAGLPRPDRMASFSVSSSVRTAGMHA